MSRILIRSETDPYNVSESVLFLEAEFDLGRVEWLWSEYDKERKASRGSEITRDEILTCPKLGEYEVKIFQARDSKDPPLSYPFEGSKFFIRPCYKVYYNLLVSCFESGEIDYVTLVGTPGTGKSLLYLYVFHRYRYENPNVTIVAAAFSKRSKLMECWVYEPGKEGRDCCEIPIIDGAVYLYDGPPSDLPLHQKMVCFTCPKFEWIDLHEKNSRHTCLFFPAWTLNELMDANDVCELGLGDAVITDRYKFFGGSARFCLSTNHRLVDRCRKRLKGKINSIDSLEKLQSCLNGKSGTLGHQIFHLLPEVSETFPFVYLDGHPFACSKVVDSLICKRITEKKKATYYELLDLIRNLRDTSNDGVEMFERWTHFHLRRGGSFELRSLDSNGFGNIIQELPAGVYEKMKAGCESVDGVAVLSDRVLLFQATVAFTHPVNAHGISERLMSIHKFDDFVNGNLKVLLIFVVPPETKLFRKQQIKLDETYNDDSLLRSIKKMRHSWREELATHGITRVGQLREWLNRKDNDYKEKFCQYLADFDSRNYSAQYNDTISEIPQYCLTLTSFGEKDHADNLSEQFLSMQNEIKRLKETNEILQRQLDAQMGA